MEILDVNTKTIYIYRVSRISLLFVTLLLIKDVKRKILYHTRRKSQLPVSRFWSVNEHYLYRHPGKQSSYCRRQMGITDLLYVWSWNDSMYGVIHNLSLCSGTSQKTKTTSFRSRFNLSSDCCKLLAVHTDTFT